MSVVQDGMDRTESLGSVVGKMNLPKPVADETEEPALGSVVVDTMERLDSEQLEPAVAGRMEQIGSDVD